MTKKEKKLKRVDLDKSLRKGNYVYSKGQIYELTTVYKTQAFGRPIDGEKGIWIKSEEISPIPLFIKLFLRIGADDNDLKMSGYRWLEHAIPSRAYNVRIVVPKRENEKWGLTLSCVTPSTLIIKEIQYLHEYQNFYREVAQSEIKLCGNTKS
jgi:hypothetical protein